MGRIVVLAADRASVTVILDGRAVAACPGESIAGMMLAQGARGFRRTAGGALRAPYCGMGTCFDCRVTVTRPGAPPVQLRACATSVEDGMIVETMTGDRP